MFYAQKQITYLDEEWRSDNDNEYFAHFHVLFIKYNFVHNKNGGGSGSMINLGNDK